MKTSNDFNDSDDLYCPVKFQYCIENPTTKHRQISQYDCSYRSKGPTVEEIEAELRQYPIRFVDMGNTPCTPEAYQLCRQALFEYHSYDYAHLQLYAHRWLEQCEELHAHLPVPHKIAQFWTQWYQELDCKDMSLVIREENIIRVVCPHTREEFYMNTEGLPPLPYDGWQSEWYDNGPYRVHEIIPRFRKSTTLTLASTKGNSGALLIWIVPESEEQNKSVLTTTIEEVTRKNKENDVIENNEKFFDSLESILIEDSSLAVNKVKDKLDELTSTCSPLSTQTSQISKQNNKVITEKQKESIVNTGKTLPMSSTERKQKNVKQIHNYADKLPSITDKVVSEDENSVLDSIDSGAGSSESESFHSCSTPKRDSPTQDESEPNLFDTKPRKKAKVSKQQNRKGDELTASASLSSSFVQLPTCKAIDFSCAFCDSHFGSYLAFRIHFQNHELH